MVGLSEALRDELHRHRRPQLEPHLYERLQHLMSRSCSEITEERIGELKGWALVRSFLAYHFTRRYTAWAGWLPRHVPRLIPPEPNAGKPLSPAFAVLKDKA
mgnify:CR=1 FL=1